MGGQRSVLASGITSTTKLHPVDPRHADRSSELRTNNRTTLGMLYQCQRSGRVSLGFLLYESIAFSSSHECIPKWRLVSQRPALSAKRRWQQASIPSFQITPSFAPIARVPPLSFSACETVVRLSSLPPHRRSVHHNLQASVNEEGYDIRGVKATSFTAPTPPWFDNRFTECKPRTFPVCGVDDVDTY